MSETYGLLLTINTGSSSLKAALYRCQQPERRVLSVEIRQIGLPDGSLSLVDVDGRALLERREHFANHSAALQQRFAWLDERGLTARLAAVGHDSPRG